ncbi:helix-turn-helix domain-containing protein [Veillonella magna]|uniref:helix-turn-helix domain-containing protein n=1 Tax=Veillonella magna TaxID=464322 RepID=UPI0026DBECB2|nr:replication initiator protein A [Veillonella magna]
MNEFLTREKKLPYCLALPRVLLPYPISSTAKLLYAMLLDRAIWAGEEDANGYIYASYPIRELAKDMKKSVPTAKRSLSELDEVGFLLRVRTGFAIPSRTYPLLP